MDDPVHELKDVVRALTEPYAAADLAAAVDKYFTADAFIWHPLLNQPMTGDGRQYLAGIYKMLRVMTINNKITFHGVMFSEDKLKACIDLTEDLDLRALPFIHTGLRFIVLLELRKEKDGKYRIWRQWDNFPTDLGLTGITMPWGIKLVSDVYKYTVGYTAGHLGRFLLDRGWLGA